jgi:rare lipoprotein A (peptidoglycan hydrolase)
VTTVVPVPPTTTTTLPAPTGSDRGSGQVTYYDHPAGRCASPWLPFGTVVTITNPATGATVVCTVDDREADTARAIDLSTATFAQLAPLWQGVVDARLRW